MNNNQFRRLVFDTPDNKNDGSAKPTQTATPSAFGAKKSSFMPMTPRTVKGGSDVDFARQVRERNAAFQPTKNFKTAAPRGVKYAAGYTDRAKARAEQEDAAGEDDKEGRIKALEEQMKLGQISEETFETLRDTITGGDISSTHLVKGLDRRLLERVRRGEDVLKAGGDGETAEQPPDIDDQLDQLEEKEVEVVTRDKVQKKGTMAAPAAVAGVKRSRDEIMAELKAQRKAAAEAKAAPALDNRWRKVGEEKNRIQIDHKGREVMITVDEDGVVKKKVRRVPKAEAEDIKATLDMPDESRPVLGSEAVVPEPRQAEAVVEESSDDDIFEGVGTAYNPLGDDDDDDSSNDEDDVPSQKDKVVPKQDANPTEQPPQITHDKEPDDISKPTTRNYFNDTESTTEESPQDRMTGVQELLKKAAKMDGAISQDTGTNNEIDGEDRNARLKKRAQMLANQDRDLDDMDMGFGSSRYDDGEDEDGQKVKLSEWKSAGLDGDDEKQGGTKGGGGGDGGKKKRKPKKRKGDANSIADIMGVIEKRKADK